MTVSSDYEPIRYSGDGVTTVFPIGFDYALAADIEAIRVDTAAVEHPLTLNVNFTVADGDLILSPALAIGEVLYIGRDTPETQQADYVQNDDFSAETHEGALDKLTRIAQELKARLKRTVTVPLSEAMVPLYLPTVAARAGKFFGFGAGGEAVPLSGTGNDAALRVDLAVSTAGARLVAWIQLGVGAIVRSVFDKLREEKSVLDFGAKRDGTDDLPAINAALATGGNIRFPGPGTYYCNGRLLAAVDRTHLKLDAGVTLLVNGGAWNGTQVPFLNSINVTGNNVAVMGVAGGSSVVQNVAASDANGIGFLHCDGGHVSGLLIDGAKAGTPAIVDDTFQSGISIINTVAGNPDGVASRVTMRDVEVRNWSQYGVNIYGELAKSIILADSHIHDNGRAGDGISVGAGVVLTRGNSAIKIIRNIISGNKGKGIFQSSAGAAASDFLFADNTITDNGLAGIGCTEEANLASVAGVGTDGIVMQGNYIARNGQHGVQIGTFDGVGYMRNVQSIGDTIANNAQYGVLVQTNDDPDNRTSNVTIDSAIFGNTTAGLGAGVHTDGTVRWNSSKIRGNPGGDVANSGTANFVSNMRGQGGTIASAATLILPPDGEVFIVTGAANITNISADGNQGRIVTFISGGTPTFVKGGDIVVPTSFAMAGNDTLTMACYNASWFQVARSVNS